MTTSLLTEMQINYWLESILKRNTEHEIFRLSEIQKFPFSIIWGEISQTIVDAFRREVSMQLGSELVQETVCISGLGYADSEIDDAFDRYREKVETGRISLINDIFFPVVIMADQFQAQNMLEFKKCLDEKAYKRGIGTDYQIIYYCLFDYGEMDGANIKKELDNYMSMDKDSAIAIVEPNKIYRDPFRQYWKALQVIAMHIFMQSSSKWDICRMLSECSNKCFVLGYWKFDVLKQYLNDYLVRTLEEQKREMTNNSKCKEQVEEIINELSGIDIEKYIKNFLRMPILYSEEVEGLFRKKMFGVRKTLPINDFYRMLYGTDNAFKAFVERNAASCVENVMVDKFLEQLHCNLYCVQNQLGSALDAILMENESALEICRNKYCMAENIVIDNRCKVDDARQILYDMIWKQEAEELLYERRISLLKTVKSYIESEEFASNVHREYINNQDITARLKVLRRECAWDEKLQIPLEQAQMEKVLSMYKLNWDEDPLGPGMEHTISAEIPQLNRTLHAWLSNNMSEMVTLFVRRIQELRDLKKQDMYAAQLNLSSSGKKWEYLFLNSNYRSDIELSHLMPNLITEKVDWQNPACMELLCIMHIGDLKQIYGMEKVNDAC